MTTGTRARLNRLFADDGRCFDVAIDRGVFGGASSHRIFTAALASHAAEAA